ncbi:hypothetical protein RJ639_027781 [Escallonia herrerae]|uniref:GDSL esterase/lipase n=1 Tax=Escallonia herrerae TaxID=1293975 RepID=A0AA89BQ86_9ASTE|nr:hypothetical protein RJ639_027781 [Escallonia herrerae]
MSSTGAATNLPKMSSTSSTADLLSLSPSCSTAAATLSLPQHSPSLNHRLEFLSVTVTDRLSIEKLIEFMHELIELGAVTLMVPGNLPIGCSSSYLTLFKGSNKEEYGPETGCLTWLNKFAEYHNELLRIELNRIQQHNPHTTIIYADYYNAAMQLCHSPKNFGFTRGALSACYGGGGSYNYNPSVQCGIPPSTVSGKPSLFFFWDGLHLTEAAYRWIFRGLFEGPYTVPHISTLCGSRAQIA